MAAVLKRLDLEVLIKIGILLIRLCTSHEENFSEVPESRPPSQGKFQSWFSYTTSDKLVETFVSSFQNCVTVLLATPTLSRWKKLQTNCKI